jgi:hypothetical protein
MRYAASNSMGTVIGPLIPTTGFHQAEFFGTLSHGDLIGTGDVELPRLSQRLQLHGVWHPESELHDDDHPARTGAKSPNSKLIRCHGINESNAGGSSQRGINLGT